MESRCDIVEIKGDTVRLMHPGRAFEHAWKERQLAHQVQLGRVGEALGFSFRQRQRQRIVGEIREGLQCIAEDGVRAGMRILDVENGVFPSTAR